MEKNPAKPTLTVARAGRRPRHTVATVISNGISPFEFAVACEVFGFDRTAELGVPWYRFMVVAADPSPVTAQTGFTIDTPYGLDDLRRADTIVVPAGTSESRPPAALVEALRAAHGRGARMVSFCTGAFTLAAAGLLDGRPATTHWNHTDRLAAAYPRVKVDPGVLYVDDGDILTSAGTAAGIDLCLHIVRKDYGADVANALARRMVVAPHRDGGQAQFVDPVAVLPAHSPDLFSDTLVYLQEHLDEDLTVEDLARRSALSPRTFARRFRSMMGTTPHQWLVRQRVLVAQQLLETTDLPIDAIATRAGFGSPAALRPHFSRIVRTSPAAYRRCFRAGA